MSEEDVDFFGSPMYAYLKELGFSDAETACELRQKQEPRNRQPEVTSGQISDHQREIIECVQQSGTDLLTEEDDAFLTNLRRQLTKDKVERMPIYRLIYRKLNSIGFTFRHQVGIVFCVVSAVVTLSVNFPTLMATVLVFLVALLLACGAVLLVRRWYYEREAEFITQLTDMLRYYVQISRKAVLLVQETNVLARGYLLPTKGAQVDGRDANSAEADVDQFCASLNACLSRCTRLLVRSVAHCSRMLIAASPHLSEIAILRDCLAQAEELEDGENIAELPSPVSELKQLHTSLVVHCSEYLRLVALAHSRADLSFLRFCSTREMARYGTIHQQLLKSAKHSYTTVRASYYVNLFAFGTDSDSDTDTKPKAQPNTKQQRSQLAEYAHAAFIHTRSALLYCAKLDSAADSQVTQSNYARSANTKETLERVASALERARECVAIAYADACGFANERRSEQQDVSARQASSQNQNDDLQLQNGEESSANGPVQPESADGDLFLEADLRREPVLPSQELGGGDLRDAFVQRQRALADRMLHEIRPALQVRAADFRERELRFKKERLVPLHNQTATPDSDRALSEDDTDAEDASDGEDDQAMMLLRRRKGIEVQHAANDEESDESASAVVQNGSAGTNLLARLVAQRAQSNRRRREETFEVEADDEVETASTQ